MGTMTITVNPGYNNGSGDVGGGGPCGGLGQSLAGPHFLHLHMNVLM